MPSNFQVAYHTLTERLQNALKGHFVIGLLFLAIFVFGFKPF